MSNMLALGIFIALVAAAALTGTQFQPGAWYETLAKPDWTPPNWLFGPVWTVLYVMIAFAGWRAWRAGGISTAVVIWGIALVLNAAWSFLMFGQNEIGLALVDIIALLAAIAAFTLITWRLDRAAALLFVPYLAWVSYATALNFAIWQLNP